jgi:5'-nucleotidase
MRERRHLLPGAAAFCAAWLVGLLGLYANAGEPVASKPKANPPADGRVELRLLGVNDFHGHLEPPEPGLGGAAWLKAHLDRAALPGRTIRVHAGDMVGASPLISGWFHDEPSIASGNAIGFDVGTVGNHEFDEGGDELLRLLRGGRRTGPAALKRDASGRLVNTSSPDFSGASYPYLAANTSTRDGATLLPPHLVLERAGARVGFIGVTTPSTPRWLLPRHSRRFRFTDISDAVNRSVVELRRQGVEAIVVLAHAGAPTPEDPADAGGEIIEEARQMSAAVDVIVAGHSHSQLNLRVGGKLVVEARSYGRAFDRIDLTLDRATGEVVDKSAEVVSTEHGKVTADPGLARVVREYAQRVAPLAGKQVGLARAPLDRGGEPLGMLTARAQRSFARADLAVVSHDSFRGGIAAGPVTYAEVAEAQGYDHRLLRMELSGRSVARLLRAAGDGFHVSGPKSIDPRQRYTVAASELLATGGALPELGGGKDEHAVGSEIEALAWYLERRGVRLHRRATRASPPLDGRNTD